MRHGQLRYGFLVAAGALLAGALAIAGCENHPDEKQAVYNVLKQHDLATVEVFQDRRTGEITLRGIVGSPDQKSSAEALAEQAAPGYSIKNQIQVQNAGLEGMEKAAAKNAALDSAIEDRYKATLKSDKRLEKRPIQYSADNGTLYLKGSVKTEAEKRQAEELAKKVPEVQHVVNGIAVKPS